MMLSRRNEGMHSVREQLATKSFCRRLNAGASYNSPCFRIRGWRGTVDATLLQEEPHAQPDEKNERKEGEYVHSVTLV